jgi:hypothetical protein
VIFATFCTEQYDFVVWSGRKRIEKVVYMQFNPVKRGLVIEPEQWPRSSDYAYRERGPVQVNEQRPIGELKIRAA